MNQSSSSSSKTHKHKCSTTAALPKPTKAQGGKKQQQQQSYRNPLQDLNNGGTSSSSIDESSNVSSLSSIEAPKGCLRFFLSHSSNTAKTPSDNSNNKPIKTKPFSSKTPKSAPNLRPSRENSSRHKLFGKPISQKVEKVKRNHPPCLYQWQSSKKRSSSSSGHANSKLSFFLGSSGSLVCNKLKYRYEELENMTIDGVCEGSEANLTPLCKVASGPGLNFGIDNKVVNDDCYEKSICKSDSNSTNSHTKTPPIQASVSPEIQCGSSIMLTTAETVTPACYGAGHVVSGVTDRRKCRPRGILTVGEGKALGSFDTDDDSEQKNNTRLVENSAVSIFPFPVEASVHWLSSPHDEDQKENSGNSSCHFQRLEECAIHNSGTSLPTDAHNCSTKDSISTSSTRKRRSASLLLPSELPEFQGFLGTPFSDNLSVSPIEEARKSRHDLDGENSPFSVGSLSSGNVMLTPQSDSSSDRRVGTSWLHVDDSGKKCSFDSKLNSVAEHLQKTSLSPKSSVSIWDPANSSFRFDSLSMPSNSVDLSKFHTILDDQASWLSNSTMDNVSQSPMRISWREGLVSRIFEMDEFDCCRYLSDEEDDAKICNSDLLKSHKSPELNDARDHNSLSGFGSTETVLKEKGTGDDETKECLTSKLSIPCAESISTDGSGLVCSEDSDWTLCYRNHLFEV